jgi:hypothetical protein
MNIHNRARTVASKVGMATRSKYLYEMEVGLPFCGFSIVPNTSMDFV